MMWKILTRLLCVTWLYVASYLNEIHISDTKKLITHPTVEIKSRYESWIETLSPICDVNGWWLIHKKVWCGILFLSLLDLGVLLIHLAKFVQSSYLDFHYHIWHIWHIWQWHSNKLFKLTVSSLVDNQTWVMRQNSSMLSR